MNSTPTASSRPLLSVRRLRVHLRPPRRSPWPGRGPLRAVEFFDLDLLPGEALVIAGESGCGKSVLARTLAGLQEATSGSVRFDGHECVEATDEDLAKLRRQVQLVPQQPFAGVRRRTTVGGVIDAQLKAMCPELSGDERRTTIDDVLSRVGLVPADAKRKLGTLTAADTQRVAIARAVAVGPRVLICDGPGAELEGAERAQVVELLLRLRNEDGLSMLLIAQDPAILRRVGDRVIMMYMGRVLEQGESEAVFGTPAHPYTRALLDARPQVEVSRRGVQTTRVVLGGEPPNPLHPPLGCVFHPRCPMAEATCVRQAPHLSRTGPTPRHYAACLFAPQAVSVEPTN